MKIIKIIILSLISIMYLHLAPRQYEYDTLFNNSQVIFLLSWNLFVLWKFRKNGFISIFNVFTLNMLITLSIPTFFPHIRISGIGGYYDPILYSGVLVQFVAFYIVFYGAISLWERDTRHETLNDIINNFAKNKSNYIIVVISIIIVLMFIFLGKAGRQNEDVILNLSLEYSFLFIFLIRIYGKDGLINFLIIHTFLILIMIKTLMYGGRIELIIAALILYVLFYEKKISYKLVTPLAIFGIIVFELLAILRAVLTSDYTNITNNRLTLLFNNANQNFLLSTEGDVIYSGMAIIGIIENELITFQSRIELFFEFILTQFLPIGSMLDSITLAQFIKSFTPTGGGGIIFSQFYFWLGDLGVVLCALLILFIFRITFYSKVNSLALFGLFSLILFPRWLFYFPDYLLKFPILYFYGTVCFYILHTITRKRKF